MRIDFFRNSFGYLLEDGKTQNRWEDGHGSSLSQEKKDFITKEGGIIPKKKGSYTVKLFTGCEDPEQSSTTQDLYPKIKTIILRTSFHRGESELSRMIRDLKESGEFSADVIEVLIAQLSEMNVYVS